MFRQAKAALLLVLVVSGHGDADAFSLLPVVPAIPALGAAACVVADFAATLGLGIGALLGFKGALLGFTGAHEAKKGNSTASLARAISLVSEVETQGRFGNGTGREFVSAYRIGEEALHTHTIETRSCTADYWRPGSTRWLRWTSRSGDELLDGNTDTTSAVRRRFEPPLVASKVRIVPYSQQPRTACLRLELYGCRYKCRRRELRECWLQAGANLDGLLSYSLSHAPNGEFPDLEEASKELDAAMSSLAP